MKDENETANICKQKKVVNEASAVDITEDENENIDYSDRSATESGENEKKVLENDI